MNRFTIAYLCLALSSALLFPRQVLATQPQPQWPTPPSRLELSTPFGELSVRSGGYVYESRLYYNNSDISPAIEGLLNIPYAFSLPQAQAALVSISDGSEDCPVTYRWVVLDNAGYHVSPPFGSCSEHVKVEAVGRLLKLHTPNRARPDSVDVYVYDGKRLKLNTKKPG